MHLRLDWQPHGGNRRPRLPFDRDVASRRSFLLRSMILCLLLGLTGMLPGGGVVMAYGQEDSSLFDPACSIDDGATLPTMGLDTTFGTNTCLSPVDDFAVSDPTPSNGDHDDTYDEDEDNDEDEDEIDVGVVQNVDYEEWGLEEQQLLDFLQTTRDYVAKTRSYVPEGTVADDSACIGLHENCAIWSLLGECQENPSYMNEHCSPYCRTCTRQCYYKENGPEVWEHAGDVETTFRRIISWQPNSALGNGSGDDGTIQPVLHILSSPDDANKGPWIVTFDNFVTKEEMERLIELGGIEGYNRSTVVDEDIADIRTSSNAWCLTLACKDDPIVRRVADRVSNLIGIDDIYSENIQLLKYEEGEYYHPHHDYIPLSSYDVEVEEQEGHRILTAFLYLNDVEAGGATNFTELNMTVVPKQGRLLVWPNVLDDPIDEIDWRTEHEAEAVTRGRKYAANFWFHNKPVDNAYHTFVCKDEDGKEHIQTPPDE